MANEKTVSSGVTFAEEEEEEGFFTRVCQERYILAVMGFWCFFVLSGLRLNISLAIVAMVNWTAVHEEQGIKPSSNATCDFSSEDVRDKKEDGPFEWTPTVQGHILGSYFYGLAATQLIGGRLSEMLSAKMVLFTGTLIATTCTLLVPVLAKTDYYAVIVLQICKGGGQGIMMPAFSVLMGKWIPPVERARFMSFIASGMPVGGFITVILSGYICKIRSLGWPYVFYIFGGVGAAWCIFWFMLVHDSPLSDPRISHKELNRIMSLRSQKAPILRLPVPVKKILTSRPVWAYIFAGFASFWCLSLYVSVVPLFMGTILKYHIEENGTLSAIPNLVEALFLGFTSLVSDYLLTRKILSATVIRKTAISIGLVGYAICMIIVTFTGCERNWSVFFLILALGMSGFNFASTAVVPVDMSPRFAGTISGIMNTFGALSGVIIPASIGYLTQNRQTMHEWSIVFYASAVICIFACIVFISFGSSETQPWNDPPVQPSESEEFPVSSEAVPESMTTAKRRSSAKERRLSAREKRESLAKDSAGPSSTEPVLFREMEDRPWRDETFPDVLWPNHPITVFFPH